MSVAPLEPRRSLMEVSRAEVLDFARTSLIETVQIDGAAAVAGDVGCRHALLVLPAPRLDVAEALDWVTSLGRPASSLPEAAGSSLREPDLDDRFVWLPDGGLAVVAGGVAARLVVPSDLPESEDGSWRPAVESIIQQAERLWSRTRQFCHDAAQPVTPRVFGGLPFSPTAARRKKAQPPERSEDPWRDLGPGSFVLPRWLYVRGRDRCSIVLCVDLPERSLEGPLLDVLLHGVAEKLRRAYDVLSMRLAGSSAPSAIDERPLPGAGTEVAEIAWDVSRQRYLELVEAIRDQVVSGRFDKVVAARHSVLSLGQPLDLVAVLAELGSSESTSTRFALCRGASTFFGATPERLIARRGLDVHTAALAGSIARGRASALEPDASRSTPAGQNGSVERACVDRAPADEASSEEASSDSAALRLRHSRKELWEHELVVRHVVERLDALCAALDVPDVPRVRRLGSVLHLETPVTGRLRRALHVLELVARLHPTPAVGGVPQVEAVRFLSENESAARGWYAGPIGWFDHNGDGDFSVALRAGLAREQKAWLWAGAGIVEESEPHAELEETELKQRAVLRAIERTLGMSKQPDARQPGVDCPLERSPLERTG